MLWEPKFFGIKPEVVFKGGFPAWSVMGESNASLMTCEPLHVPAAVGRVRPGAPGPSVTFMAQAAIDAGVAGRWIGLREALRAHARHARAHASADMLHNDALPAIEVDPETYRVRSTASCARASRSTGCRSAPVRLK